MVATVDANTAVTAVGYPEVRAAHNLGRRGGQKRYVLCPLTPRERVFFPSSGPVSTLGKPKLHHLWAWGIFEAI